MKTVWIKWRGRLWRGRLKLDMKWLSRTYCLIVCCTCTVDYVFGSEIIIRYSIELHSWLSSVLVLVGFNRIMFASLRLETHKSVAHLKETSGISLRSPNHDVIYKVDSSSLQIIFVYRQVICQARGQFWADKKPVWSDKNTKWYEVIKFQREWSIDTTTTTTTTRFI